MCYVFAHWKNIIWLHCNLYLFTYFLAKLQKAISYFICEDETALIGNLYIHLYTYPTLYPIYSYNNSYYNIYDQLRLYFDFNLIVFILCRKFSFFIFEFRENCLYNTYSLNSIFAYSNKSKFIVNIVIFQFLIEIYGVHLTQNFNK